MGVYSLTELYENELITEKKILQLFKRGKVVSLSSSSKCNF